jgi:hypothetical protein
MSVKNNSELHFAVWKLLIFILLHEKPQPSDELHFYV